MEQYLIKYLKDFNENSLIEKYIDFFKVELDWFIYNYGENFSKTHSRQRKRIKYDIYRKTQYLSSLFKKNNTESDKINILSGVLFQNQDVLHELGVNLVSSVFQPIGFNNIIGDYKSIHLLNKKNLIIKKGVFNDLLSKELFLEFEYLQKTLLKKYNEYKFRALFVSTDQYFETKYLIDIFKQLQKPSFIFSHGLPGIYSLSVDNRSNYLMVWGDQIKQNYVNNGFNADKIFVTGSPSFSDFNIKKKLRNSLDNILIIPCSSVLWHQHEWGKPRLIDRSMIVLYLYKVQKVLSKMGVKQARFRPHPSISSDWVYGFLDQDFYKIDKDSLKKSLSKATVVIGATSTVFLQALTEGVNYIVFEPNENGENLIRSKLVPPFDGSDSFVQIANNENDLFMMIKDHYQTNSLIIEKYIAPFNPKILKNLIK